MTDPAAPGPAVAPSPGPRDVHAGWHPAEWTAELAGTALLVLGGLSAIALDFGSGSTVARLLPSASARLLVTGVRFAGTGSLVAVSPLGRRSGAHLNPAVSLAFWRLDHLHPGDLAGYVAAQLVGALAGAGLASGLWGHRLASAGSGVTQPGAHIGPAETAVLEAMMTALLVLLILAMVSSDRTARWTPLAVWVLIATLVWQLAPRTGTSLNPARSLGPALAAGRFHDLPLYLVAPLVGSLLATTLWLVVIRRPLATAKIFHDPSYPSVVRSSMPAMPPTRRA